MGDGEPMFERWNNKKKTNVGGKKKKRKKRFTRINKMNHHNFCACLTVVGLSVGSRGLIRQRNDSAYLEAMPFPQARVTALSKAGCARINDFDI
jgi:hypothetical protein